MVIKYKNLHVQKEYYNNFKIAYHSENIWKTTILETLSLTILKK